MIVSVPLTLPGLVNSINTNIHVGVGARLFDLAYLLGVSHPPIPKIGLALISINPTGYLTLYSSRWHRPSTSHSRVFSPPTKRSSIMQSWSRKCFQTTVSISAAMKRRLIIRSMTHRQFVRSGALSSCESETHTILNRSPRPTR